MRCAIYTRKSVEDDFQKEQTSLESQRINCEKYAESRGWDVIPTLYEDYGRTGANMDREGFQRLLNDIRAGKIDCVVVYKIDRLTRSLMDFVNVIDGFFKEHHVSFVSATESFDTTTPVGTLVMTLLVVFAQFEREQTCVRVKDKVRTSKMNGIWMGGYVPFGYKSVDRKLVLDEQTAPFVKSVFEDYLRNKSLYDIAQYLNLYRPTMEGGSVFTYAKLLSLIRNPIYKGWISYKGEFYKGQHEPIVSEEVWQQANEKTHSKRCRHVTKQETNSALLKGIIRCEACDRSMIPFYSQKKNAQKYCYYICLNKQKGNAGKGLKKNVNSDLLENIVIKEVRKFLKKPEIFEEFLEFLYHNSRDASQIYQTLQNMDVSWDLLTREEQKKIVRSLVKRVSVSCQAITITFTTLFLKDILGDLITKESSEICTSWVIKGQLWMRGDKPQVFMSEDLHTEKSVLQAFLQAQVWQEELENGTYKSFEELATAYGINKKTISRYMVFNMLLPKIQEAILNETLSPQFRIVDFTRKKIPDDWEKQDLMFGVS